MELSYKSKSSFFDKKLFNNENKDFYIYGNDIETKNNIKKSNYSLANEKTYNNIVKYIIEEYNDKSLFENNLNIYFNKNIEREIQNIDYLNAFSYLVNMSNYSTKDDVYEVQEITKNGIYKAFALLKQCYYNLKLNKVPEISSSYRGTLQFEYYNGENYLEIEFFEDYGIIFNVSNDQNSLFKKEYNNNFINFVSDKIEKFFE